MKTVFRVDASLEIGTGHVMRCLTLAKELRTRGVECLFVSRDHEGNLNELLHSQGFAVKVLPNRQDTRQTSEQAVLAYSNWLGASWCTDAQQTIEALGDTLIDWLIVDHYALDKRWESQLRSQTKKIMVIDDIADRTHDCDLLLDQNLVTDFETRYGQLVAPNCTHLLGPRYALLQSDYAKMRSYTPLRNGPVRRIFVYFGGSDLRNLTGLTIHAFLKLEHNDLELDVVINPNSQNAVSVRSQVSGYANIKVHEMVPTLAPLMAKADLAIGASGATTWERCCLGLPSLVISVAENQRPIAESLDMHGLILWVGDQESVTIENLSQAINKVLNYKSLSSWSKKCYELVDGKGVGRVASALTLGANTSLRLRQADFSDEKLLLDWANDHLVRQNSFNTSPIHPDSHRQWFNNRLKNLSNCKFYIAETQDNLPIGQVRFERKEVEEWEIHYGLWVGARGLGLGAKIVKLALEKLRGENPLARVIGYVKSNNIPSRRIFETVGFLACKEDKHVFYTLSLDRKNPDYERVDKI